MLTLHEPADLPDELPTLKAVALHRNQLARQFWEQVDILQYQIAQLTRARLGTSAEHLAGQAELFTETVALPTPPAVPGSQVAGHVRRGRPALPKDLPRVRIEYDLSDDEKAEFDSIQRIGVEHSETLDYTPAKLTVIEHARIKYACSKDGESTIRTAFAQPSPLPKSSASAGLLAQVSINTFVDHLPLHRQEVIWKRKGFPVSRSTLCDWKLGVGELLSVLMPPLKTHLLRAPRVHSDDTTMPLLQRGRGSTKTARLWGYLGAGERVENGVWVAHGPAVSFDFAESRHAIHPTTFLRDYHGYLQIDAYSGYDVLFRSGKVIEVGCWTHCRRRFFEIAKMQSVPGLAAQALSWIARLYAIETTIMPLPPDQKHHLRQRQSVPLLNDLRLWLDGHASKVLPRSSLALAFGYALRNWQVLIRYTESGILLPDNNAMERCIRPIAVGRNNTMFVGSVRGGQVAATMYCLLSTARLNGLNPYDWLKDTLTRLPSHPSNKVHELLPLTRQSPA